MQKPNPSPSKEGMGKEGEPIPQEGEKRPEDEKEEEEKEEEMKEKYVVQVSREVEGEDSYVSVKKEGKIFVFSSQRNAEESLKRIMQRHPELLRGRVMQIKEEKDKSILIPVMEINGKQVIQHSKDVLPPEMQGYIDDQMLSMMDKEEIQGIRSLISDLIRKKQEIERFSRIAVQRSSFLRSEERVKRMQELAKKYKQVKARLEKAKEAWEKTKEEVEDFISAVEKEYPELNQWIRVNITGEGSLPTPNRGQGRRRVPEGKKGIILRFLKEHRGQRFKEVEIIKGIVESGMGQGYSWKQQTVNPRIRSMLSQGLISQDSEGRYYLP